MADDSKQSLSTVLQQLTQVYQLVVRDSQNVHRVLADGHLLFNDWPSKSKNKEADDKTVPVKEDEKPINDVEQADQQERLHQDLIDKAIAKAELTRKNIVKRKEKDEQFILKSDARLGSGIDIPGNKDQITTSQTTYKGQHKATKLQNYSENSRSKGVYSGSASISKSKLDSLVGPKSSRQQTKLIPNKGVKYAPAHTKAPFKTESAKRGVSKRGAGGVSSRPTSKTRTIHVKPAPQPQQAQRSKLGTNKVPPVSDIKNSEKSDGQTINFDLMCNQLEELKLSNRSWPLESNFEESKGSSAIRSQNENEDMASRKVGSGTSNDAKSMETEEPIKFKLTKDGHKLSVPSRLARSLANNRRMRASLLKESLTVKVKQSSNNRDKFIDKLSTYLFAELSDKERQVCQKLFEIKQTYATLLKMLTSLEDFKLDESSRWGEILRAKRTLEFILISFSSLEDEYRRLLEVAQPFIIRCQNGCVEINTSQRNKHGTWWLPSFAKTPRVLTRKGDKGRIIRYSRKKQLTRYHTLLHGYQLLLLENNLLSEFSPGILSALSNMDNHQGNFAQLYRSAYSLMCHSGRHFPTFVEDNIEELEKSEDEDEVNDF